MKKRDWQVSASGFTWLVIRWQPHVNLNQSVLFYAVTNFSHQYLRCHEMEIYVFRSYFFTGCRKRCAEGLAIIQKRTTCEYTYLALFILVYLFWIKSFSVFSILIVKDYPKLYSTCEGQIIWKAVQNAKYDLLSGMNSKIDLQINS